MYVCVRRPRGEGGVRQERRLEDAAHIDICMHCAYIHVYDWRTMANKRQKLDPHIDKILDLRPINKIRKILAAAAEADDDAANPKTWVWKEAFAAPFEAVEATIPLTMEDGTSWDWPLCDPNKLLQQVVAESPALAAVFASAAAKAPPSADHPWRLVIGFDEFVPGIV